MRVPTHNLVTFIRPDQIVEREQDAADILEPFRPDIHGRSEAGVESGIDVSCTIV